MDSQTGGWKKLILMNWLRKNQRRIRVKVVIKHLHLLLLFLLRKRLIQGDQTDGISKNLLRTIQRRIRVKVVIKHLHLLLFLLRKREILNGLIQGDDGIFKNLLRKNSLNKILHYYFTLLLCELCTIRIQSKGNVPTSGKLYD